MRALVVGLLLLTALPGWTLPSPADGSGWPVCFDASAWDDLEKQIQIEIEFTARDAVKAALEPHLAYEAALVAENKVLKDNSKWWKAFAIVGWGATVFTVGLFVASRLIPTVSP
jgi:hypothetical protein